MLVFRIVFLMLFVSSFAYADTISVADFSATSGVNHLNSFKNTVVNEINGSLKGSLDGVSATNIAADSVYEINMADDANVSIFMKELLNITTDSASGGTLTQNTVVESGCVPADDTDLTSDISACVAFVNGKRISKGATANTYTASRDCYVDLSQSGTYTTSCVTNGASQPSVAANSTRLAKVVTDGTEITTVTSLFTTRVPGLVIPSNYRDGLSVSQASTTTITVMSGSLEVNNSMVTKTTATTLTISTAGDYAGGSSLRATSTHGYVGVDSSGNIKMHTTAPSHSDYSLSSTAGVKRYAAWSGTTYRIIGHFYMNATGSGELDSFGVANIIDTVVSLTRSRIGHTVDTINDTTYGSDMTETVIPFYSEGSKEVKFILSYDSPDNTHSLAIALDIDGAVIGASERSAPAGSAGNTPIGTTMTWQQKVTADGAHIATFRAKVASNDDKMARKMMVVDII